MIQLAESHALTLASWANKVSRSALQEMLSLTGKSGLISFALGLPAAEFFPTTALQNAALQVLSEDNRALQYGPPTGHLKAQIVQLMKNRNISCRPEQIFITSGAQQAISLLCCLLLDNGGRLIAEDQIYPGFQQAIEPFQPEILTVNSDFADGIDVDQIEAILQTGERPAFIYCIADGHNPLGVSISLEKRRRLVELAERFSVPIIEDDPYGFFCYESESLPPLRALNDQWVFYIGTFSKILAPTLRVGWLIVPEELQLPLSIIKEASDINTATLAQRIISAYLDKNDPFDHINNLNIQYKMRRDLMLDLIEKLFPGDTQFIRPASGFFNWVRLPNMINTFELLKRSIDEQNVAFIPGEAFSIRRTGAAASCLRLNFSHSSAAQIIEGMTRLGTAIQSIQPEIN